VISTTGPILSPEKIGLDVIAIAAVSLEDHHPASVREFDEMVANRPEILECYAMSGQHDYHLKVICKSIKAYEVLLREHIMPCRAVHHVNTSFVLRSNKYTTALPLEE
jgi:Lrp/AsnC family transcriptional regulator